MSGPCWWITPFGSLVEPEVCTITIRSAGATPASAAASTSSSARRVAGTSTSSVGGVERDARAAPGVGGSVERRRRREVETRHRFAQRMRRSRGRGTTSWRAAPRCRRCAAAVRSSALVENVLSGTATAPMRAAANQPTTNSGPFGCSRPTCVPRPAPTASRPFASAADRDVGIGVREDVVVADQQRMVARGARRARAAARAR